MKRMALSLGLLLFWSAALANDRALFISQVNEQLEENRLASERLRSRIGQTILEITELKESTDRDPAAKLRQLEDRVRADRIGLRETVRRLDFWDRILFQVEKEPAPAGDFIVFLREKLLELTTIEATSNHDSDLWTIFASAGRSLRKDCLIPETVVECIGRHLAKSPPRTGDLALKVERL